MTATSGTADTLKDHARELAHHTQEAVTSRAHAEADKAKNDAAAQVQQAANAAQAAADELTPSSPQSQALNQVADAVEGVAQQMRDADVSHLANQISSFARQNPAIFVGGAALAGLALARFLKARPPHDTTTSASDDDPWQSAMHTPTGGVPNA